MNMKQYLTDFNKVRNTHSFRGNSSSVSSLASQTEEITRGKVATNPIFAYKPDYC